ncbi:putative exonuclease [Exophiala dermatitidis]
MVVGSKRTAADAGLSPAGSKPGQPHQNANDLSTRHSPQANHPRPLEMQKGSGQGNNLQPGRKGEDQGEWSVAESKSSRKKRRKIEQDQDPKSEPSIAFLDTKPARVQLKALQDLVLYVLADGVAPTWLAVKNVRQIEKVVVLMIPGLDRDLVEKYDILTTPTNVGGSHSGAAGDLNPKVASNGQDSTAEDSNGPSTTCPPSEETNSPATGGTPSQHELTRRILRHVFEVKAPGDSRANRVHSPLQGMLIAPLPEKDKSEGTYTNKYEKYFQSNRTSISAFVHSAEELREAEYPVHQAAFTDPKDAQLEKTRRKQTFQSSSAGWVDTDVSVSEPSTNSNTSSRSDDDALTQGLKPYAVDCEMVLTEDDKHSLARISVVDWHGKTVMDKYVKPALPIKNYFTQYSGITPQHLENVTTTLEDIQQELLGFLGKDSVLLGHSLESDLNALKLTHPFIVDTSIIYPHPRGLPLRSSLKFLANKYLKREIQKAGADGHDSVEDARAVLDLVRLKCEKGPKWGTQDANGESIFRRIGRCVRPDGSGKLRQTAIVEYGTPERGFGKDATYKIACNSDDEIVQGILRAAHGDGVGDGTLEVNEDGNDSQQNQNTDIAATTAQDHNEINTSTTTDKPCQAAPKLPPGGVEFIWGRFRDLEAVRGWNTPPAPPSLDSKDNQNDNKHTNDISHHDEARTATTNEADTGTSIGTGDKDKENSTSTSTPTSSDSDPLHVAATNTLTRLRNLFASLPPRTLLVVYSGTADMRPVLEMQQLHAQYRREFKVKKWDELSVQWTDVEEQKLRGAVERARRGVGILAIR